MDAQTKNKYQQSLVELQANFIALGITKMPVKEINHYMPKLKPNEVIEWSKKSSAVWHFRSTEFATYLPIFQKVYNDIVNIEVKEDKQYKTA